MVIYDAAPRELERTMCYPKKHQLSVIHNADGGYRVTCKHCVWWTTIPSGEQLKGWGEAAVMTDPEA